MTAPDAPKPFAEWAPAVALLRDALRALPEWEEAGFTLVEGKSLQYLVVRKPFTVDWTVVGRDQLNDLCGLKLQLALWAGDLSRKD